MYISVFCRYPGKPGCHLQPEVDGLRIVSNYSSEFIHRVTSKYVGKKMLVSKSVEITILVFSVIIQKSAT